MTNKTQLRNGNCPITDPITEIGVAHTVGHGVYNLSTFYIINYANIKRSPRETKYNSASMPPFTFYALNVVTRPGGGPPKNEEAKSA